MNCITVIQYGAFRRRTYDNVAYNDENRHNNTHRSDVYARRYVISGTNHDAASNIETTDLSRQSFDPGQLCRFGHLVRQRRSRILFSYVTSSYCDVIVLPRTNICEGKLFRFCRNVLTMLAHKPTHQFVVRLFRLYIALLLLNNNIITDIHYI